MLDILIRNGWVVDGSGAPRRRADVAVEGGRIVEVGLLESAQAARVIDVAGAVVAPGFIDMHSHADFSLPVGPTADSMVHQGITTAVVGQCGDSPVPLLPETRAQVIAAAESAEYSLPWEAWSSFGSYLDHLQQTGISVNVVPLVGQGTVRAAVMGFAAGPANPEQVARMQAEVERALDEGAWGLSTGLIYPPGCFTPTEEIIALMQPVGRRGGLYFTHMRDEDAGLLDSIAEAVRIGRESGAGVEISHYKAVGRANWHLSARGLELIEQARSQGLDVSADLYPYLATATSLGSLLPDWAREGGKPAILARLADPQARRRMAADIAATGRAWDQTLVSSSPRRREYEGHDLATLAAQASKDPVEWLFDALLETELDIGRISFGMCEENRELELRYPAMMVGTDAASCAVEGPLSHGLPHPRTYGTFARVLGHYVRERRVLTLEEAVWRMTGLAAQKLRLRGRGFVRQGHKADLVVFDPLTVADLATYQAPHRYPAGISHVVVNGALVVDAGAHTQARPGEILRKSSTN